MELKRMTLDNLGNGAALEKFDDEFNKLIENVMDPNTEPDARRQIVMTVTVKPDKGRGHASIDVAFVAKLAPARAYESRVYMGADRRTGELMVCEDNPNQLTLDMPERQPSVVESMERQTAKQGE